MAIVRRFRLRGSRWIPLLLTVVYAIFGGVSFQFFHEMMFEALAGTPRALFWVRAADGAYITLTVLLIFLLISRLLRMLDEYESEIERSEERFRGVVETTRDWVWELDENCQYTFSSANVQALLGVDPAAIIGNTPFDLIPADDLHSARELLRQLVTDRQPFHLIELHYRHQDGRTMVVESTGAPIFDQKGRFRGFRGIDRDVTERRQAEQSLERSHDYYRALFDDLPLPIWRSDADGRIIYYNHAGENLLGKRLEEASTRLGIIEPTDAQIYDEDYRHAFTGRQPFLLAYRLRRYDGQYTLIVHAGRPCNDLNGKFMGYIGYFLEMEQIRSAVAGYQRVSLN